MVNLKEKPYFLSDDDVLWVEKTIFEMTDEEKVGQLFFQLTADTSEEYLKELMQKYHLGGCRYNNMPASMVKAHNEILQKYAKIPIFIACNTESGGNGCCSDGSYIANGIKIGATGNAEYAKLLGKYANEEAVSIGCNMAFAPVCDIHYNWMNTEIASRAFGGDGQMVAEMSKAYLEGAHEAGVVCAAKHFPGNGQDFRDAHISNNLNSFGENRWMQTYGYVYKELIESGLEAIMGGHIMMREYMREISPGIRDEEILPATLCPEIMTGLLRDKLGFNGMVVTDASHMVGMTDRMKRSEMLPASINAGCDMFLFFNDPDEDFGIMLGAYRSGKISEQRMTEALTRILGLKARMGLHKVSKQELSGGEITIGKEEYRATEAAISRDAITLVKYKDEGVLPISPEKYKRVMIVYIKGAPGPMDDLIKAVMGVNDKKNPAEDLRDRLIDKGFDAFIYESPIEQMRERIAAGEKPSINLYFAGKHAISEFVSDKDLVITLCDVSTGRPSFGFSKGGGEIPWYVFEIPVVAISVNAPTMLADIPEVRTYINAYDSKPSTMEALIDKLMIGKNAFKGKDPIDSFCGLWDSKI